MVRRLLASVPGIVALSIALVASNAAAKPNACLKDCRSQKSAARSAAVSEFKACKAAAADKAAKKVCKQTRNAAFKAANDAFKAAKPGCKANPTSTCSGSTTTTTIPTSACGGHTVADTCTGTAGNPIQARITVPPTGSDLDNGYSGASHNFVVVNGSTLNYCLFDCDASTDSSCTACGVTGAGTKNTKFFGAPLPLLSSGVPVCIVNEFVDPVITGTFDLATGAMSSDVNLNSKVYVRLGKGNLVCPRCQGGSGLGTQGTCQGGARNGQSCTVNGLVNVAGSTPSAYAVSTDCPPEESPPGIGLSIDLPLTTAKAESLPGPKPCAAESQQKTDDSCIGGSCTQDCTGKPDEKGGINQMCCAGGSAAGTPCFPTKNGGTIVRTGTPTIPQPAWPDPTYPKTSADGQDVKLAATFCIDKTGDASVDNNAGLPGPGAIILPGKVEILAGQ